MVDKAILNQFSEEEIRMKTEIMKVAEMILGAERPDVGMQYLFKAMEKYPVEDLKAALAQAKAGESK